MTVYRNEVINKNNDMASSIDSVNSNNTNNNNTTTNSFTSYHTDIQSDNTYNQRVRNSDYKGDIIYIDKALPGKENYLGSFHFDSTPSDFTFMYAFQGYALSDVIKMACNAASYAGYTYIIIENGRENDLNYNVYATTTDFSNYTDTGDPSSELVVKWSVVTDREKKEKAKKKTKGKGKKKVTTHTCKSGYSDMDSNYDCYKPYTTTHKLKCESGKKATKEISWIGSTVSLSLIHI